MEALLEAPAGVTSLRVSPLHPSAGETPSFVVLSTYPPTQCGLATFAASLYRGLTDVGASRVGVIRVSDDPNDVPSEEVVGILRSQSARSRLEVARLINSYDVLFLQHEFCTFPYSKQCTQCRVHLRRVNERYSRNLLGELTLLLR